MSIEVYTDYTFMDNENSKYCLSVNDLSTYIEFFVYSDKAHKWCKKEGIDIPSNFAYEIAKKIIEEYEKMNSIPTQQKEYEYRADLFRGAE